ncbi:MAG: type 4a pilus biogenesis protein PilO [Pseudorhodobacter sp.]|nr:type 4a pilus biogenesis protein PilO [Frankiaceae bacterium]
MEKIKQYVTLAVLGAVVILAAGWFLLVSPKKGEATDLQAQAASQVSANAVLATQLQALKVQAKDLPKKQAELARVAAKIPDNPSLPSLIRALTAASTKAGVEFVSVTPGPPAALAPVAGAAAVAPVAPAAAPVAPVPGAVAAPAVGSSAGELAAIPVTLNVVGDYFEVEQFLAELENLPRALRVSNLTLAPGASPVVKTGATAASPDDGRTLTSTITGSVFMAAGRPPATPVVAPVAAPAK